MGLGAREWRGLRGTAIAMAAQEAELTLNPVRRVGSQIMAVLRVHGWRRAAARRRTGELLEAMGLPERSARAYPHQLSGGQRQRVVLAQALAGAAGDRGPALLIADEPTTGLDAETRRLILAVLRRRVQAGMGLLIISHEREVLDQIAARVVVMGGSMRASDSGLEACPAGNSGGWRRLSGGQNPRESGTRGVAAPWSAPVNGARRRGGDETGVGGPRAAGGGVLIQATGLRKSYRRGGGRISALTGASLELGTGETVVLMGPSGAGKSTLARCLAGLDGPDSGTIERAAGVGSRGVQMIWQDPAGALNPRMMVTDIIAEPWRIAGNKFSRVEREQRVGGLLRQVGLPAEWMEKRPGQLSGGEKRRVGIARALAVDPRVLILDEALAGIEPELREGLVLWLEWLQARRDLACLFITHDLALAGRLGGRRLRMRAGRVEAIEGAGA